MEVGNETLTEDGKFYQLSMLHSSKKREREREKGTFKCYVQGY